MKQPKGMQLLGNPAYLHHRTLLLEKGAGSLLWMIALVFQCVKVM